MWPSNHTKTSWPLGKSEGWLFKYHVSRFSPSPDPLVSEGVISSIGWWYLSFIENFRMVAMVFNMCSKTKPYAIRIRQKLIFDMCVRNKTKSDMSFGGLFMNKSIQKVRNICCFVHIKTGLMPLEHFLPEVSHFFGKVMSIGPSFDNLGNFSRLCF